MPALPYRLMIAHRLCSAALLAITVIACTACSYSPTPGEVLTYEYGQLEDGRTAHIYLLTNENGLTAKVTDFGATLVSLNTPALFCGCKR